MSVRILRPGVSLFILCSLSGFSSACGQSAPQGPQGTATLRLTLKQAVQIALKQNPRQVVAQLLVQQSARDSQIERAPLLPQIRLGASAALEQYNLQTVERLPEPKAAGPFQHVEGGTFFSQTLLNLPLIRQYQIGREGTVEANANQKTNREDVAAAVVAQYLLVLKAFADYEATAAQVALAERLFEQATELQKTGVALNIDVVRANVQLQIERQVLIRADTETRTTRYRLAELLDLPREQEPQVADHFEFFDLPTFDREASIAKALSNRPEMKAIAAETRIAELSRKSASDERLPQLDFTGFWSYQGVHFSDSIPSYSYAASLSIPLFVGGRIHTEIERQKLVEQQVDENRKALEARIVREVKTALDELESARTAVDVANAALQLANEEVAQAQRRFQAGVTTNVEVIEAQTTLAVASDNQVEALYVFNQSRANLARAMGEIENAYTK